VLSLSAAFFYTPFTAYKHLWYNITAMEHKELSCLFEALTDNKLKAMVGGCLHANEDTARDVAIAATVIDYLRGDIEGLPSPLSELARNNDDSSYPSPPQDNGGPNPKVTETLKRLGELGLQSLNEIQGYKYDSNNHFLLLINNRYADTGWEKGDSHICTFVTIVKDMGLAIPCIE
jgi:hypothetical protein